MSINGFNIINVLSVAIGVVGSLVTFLTIFVEVKNERKIKVTPREMIFILMWLSLLVLGIFNLYINNKNYDGQGNNIQSEGNQEPDGQNGEDAIKKDDENMGLSPEEVLVKQNFDLIQRLKAEYPDKSTEIIKSESSSVWLLIYETAGYIFQDLKKTGESVRLEGEQISSVKVVIMDYVTDEIICTLTSEDVGAIRYSPGNQDKFYCVIFHDDYDIYVTHPFQVVAGEGYDTVRIFLEKNKSKYTPLFQLRLYIRDLSVDEKYTIVPSDYEVCFSCKKISGHEVNGSYTTHTSESGIISWGSANYFSLNTDYSMDIYLRCESDSGDKKSTLQTFDGSVTNSNLIDFYFEFNNEHD